MSQHSRESHGFSQPKNAQVATSLCTVYLATDLIFNIRIHLRGLRQLVDDKSVAISFLYVCMVNTIYLLSFVETPRKFIIAELSIRKLGSSSVLIIIIIIINNTNNTNNSINNTNNK